jgi:glycosyltransferase involved in cell wall biosynthesis
MSHTAADEIVRYLGADRDKIRVIYPSYNQQCRVLVDTDLDAVKQKYGLPDRFILFVGGLAPLKNLSNLLKAFREVEARLPHKLVIVGFKRWKFKGDVDLIDSLGLRERIVMTGYLPDADLPAVYNLAELFVMPSLYEGFGIPVLEAMACACPVLTTRTGCTPEVVGDAALLVDPRNPLEIADGIRAMLSDDDLRNKLVKKGLERVKQFNWDKCARETLAVFDSVGRGRR